MLAGNIACILSLMNSIYFRDLGLQKKFVVDGNSDVVAFTAGIAPLTVDHVHKNQHIVYVKLLNSLLPSK